MPRARAITLDYFLGAARVGKTSLARLLAHEINARFIQLSAVLARVKIFAKRGQRRLRIKITRPQNIIICG